jgi:hypothetical protein
MEKVTLTGSMAFKIARELEVTRLMSRMNVALRVNRRSGRWESDADKSSSELWTSVHRPELSLSRYSRPPKHGNHHQHSMSVGHGHRLAITDRDPREIDSTSHGSCRANPPGNHAERW